MRTNIYKEQIMKLLRDNHLMSIAAIHKKISVANHSTIFRNIEQLVASGEVKKISISKDVVLYEVSNHAHDHFVCNDCGDIEEITISTNNSDLKGKVVSDVVVRGTCCNCV